MQNKCTQTGATFEVTDDDHAFYERIAPSFNGKKFAIPEPELCPDARHQRRMAFRNERHLYKRKCDLSGKQFLSIYDQETPFPVYSYDSWWSDEWDAFEHGRDYDPSRSFFDQFQEMYNQVPRLGIVIGHNENCDYCNYTNYSKGSYLCFGCHSIDHCYHNWRAHWSEYCMDNLQLDKGNLCYECIDCDECYNLRFSQDCASCSDSAFLFDCRNTKDSLFCIGLRNAQYHVFNEKLSKEEYEAKKKELALDTWNGIEQAKKQFAEFLLTKPHKNLFALNSENARGDHVISSRNLYECYHCKNAEDCRYMESCEDVKDSMDNTFSGWPGELLFETMSAGVNCYNYLFSTASWSCSNLIYCDSCHHSSDLFGCIGLRKKNQYCILNKQYTKDEYDSLCAQIIEDMERRGEWGAFFPQNISPHAYNETAAQEFYPLTKEEAEKFGYSWKDMKDEVPNVEKTIPGDKLPEKIDDVPDDVLQWAIKCTVTGRLFRVIQQELDLLRQMQLPLPRIHPDERHRQRMAKRNPRRLWQRQCGKCGKEVESTYAPDRSEAVYCEECYLAEVY